LLGPGPAVKVGGEPLRDGRSDMDNSPFSQTSNGQDSVASRRRSTRIDFVTTVLLSGKDSTGAPFREFTQTSTVNLHGCKLRTSYRIMVGMLINIECPQAGTSGKGVCVRVWDPSPGVPGHEIAIQLIKPQNLWGVPTPPPDWEVVAKTLVQGRQGQTERGTRPAVNVPSGSPISPLRAPTILPGTLPAVATAASSRTTTILPGAIPAVTSPPPLRTATILPGAMPAVTSPEIPVRPVPLSGPSTEQRLADLEKRATQLVSSVLDIMRGQAEELTRDCLEEFRQQVDVLIQNAEERLRQGSQQSYDESAASLVSLRSDLLEQMATRGAQIVRSTDEAMRSRLRNQLSLDEKIAPARQTTEK